MKTQQTKTCGYRMQVVLRGEFTAVHAYTKKSENSDWSNFEKHLGAWKKSNKINPNSVDGKKSLRSDQKLGRYKKVQRINEQRVDTGRDNQH